jgi:hypothetical protein
MKSTQTISPVSNELASRAPTVDVFINWKLWYFGVLIIVLSILLAGIGIYLSLSLSDWTFLSRFGALEAILGSYLIGRPIWRHRYKSRFVSATLTKGGVISDEQFAEYVMERTDIWFFYIGFLIAAIGSIIWGFADLLNCIMPGDAFKCAI